jgi:hypothetical protein|nr:MAG TPA: hypothetical protein [Caudoviricetes sp.]
MYGELRTALNNVSSQFGQLALQLEESGHTKARAVIDNVKKLHEIDDFCAAHYFARRTGQLIKALAFNTSDYDDDFVNAVIIGATGYACGYYPTIGAPEISQPSWKQAMNVVIRNKLGLFVPTAEVEKSYSEIRSACGWIAEEYPEDARKRLESAVTIYDAIPIYFDLCRDYAEKDVGDISDNYYNLLALVYSATMWSVIEKDGAWYHAQLSRKFAKMSEQRAIDLTVTMSERMNFNAVPLLHFVQRQISLNNFKCAAACAIAWRDELRELTPYVSEKTRIWICEA